MERLFVAALPDEATVARLRRIPRPDERGVRWVREENWHVTLRFLGTCDPATVTARLGAATLPRCTARLGSAVEWLGTQLVVPVAGVDALATAVRGATEGIGDPPRPHFRGHLTVARTRRDATTTVIGHPVDGAFVVHAAVLMRSELAPDGARYTTIAIFPTV